MTDLFLKLLDKISSYQIFNYLFPGVIFIEGVEIMKIISFPDDILIFRFFLYYIAGMILSRIGSVIIEKIYKKFCWVIYANYKNYLSALKKDEKLDILVMENNTYRTLIATFLVLLLLYCLSQFSWFSIFNNSTWSTIVFIVLLIILFSFSFAKQTSFIRKRTHNDLGIEDSEVLAELKKKQKEESLF